MPHNTGRATPANRPLPLSLSPHPDQLPPPNRLGPVVSRTSRTSIGGKIPAARGGKSYRKTERRFHPPLIPATEERHYQGTNTPKHSPSTHSTRSRPSPSPPPPEYATPSRSRILDRPPTPVVSRTHNWNRRILPLEDDQNRRRERYICKRRLGVQSNRGDAQNGHTPGSDSCLILVMPEGTPVHLASANNVPGARLWHAHRVGNGGFQIIKPVP
jgi:hypothetical protein